MIVILFVGILIFSTYAYVKKKLTLSGSIAACIVGGMIAVGLGLYGLLLIALFFFSTSTISTLKRGRENEVNDVVEKGDCRDANQVLANGGVAAIVSLLYLFFPSPLLICGFVASIAAANADTWASEIGTFTKQRPVHILKWKRVRAGTSGAITTLGSAAAFAGSFIIVGVAIFFWWGSYYNSHLLLMILTIAGFIGNLFDTLLGASFQVEYRCVVCKMETEQKQHCEAQCVKASGLKWMNNDIVNLSCTLVGAVLGIGTGLILF